MDIIVQGERIGRIRKRTTSKGIVRYVGVNLDGKSAGTYGTWTEAQYALIMWSGLGDPGEGRVRSLTGTWELVHQDGRVLTVDSEVSVWSPGGVRQAARITKLWPPHKPSSTGKIEYIDGSGRHGGCYATVINARYRCLDGDGTTW